MSAERWFRLQGYIEPCRNEKAHAGVCVRTPPCATRVHEARCGWHPHSIRDEGNERMSEQAGTAIPERGGEPAEAPCRKWRGPFFVSNGRKFSGDCRYCGWPKPDHRAASPTVKEEQKVSADSEAVACLEIGWWMIDQLRERDAEIDALRSAVRELLAEAPNPWPSEDAIGQAVNRALEEQE